MSGNCEKERKMFIHIFTASFKLLLPVHYWYTIGEGINQEMQILHIEDIFMRTREAF